MNIRDRKLGTLVGLAVGDAMGAPYEFMHKSEYKPTLEYNTGGCWRVAKGEWTDDTSMALCMGHSISDIGGFVPNDVMTRFGKWYTNGYMSTRHKCFDIGNTTRKSIVDFLTNRTIFSTVTKNNESGNGTIMRLAPVPMVYDGSYETLIGVAELSSKLTHSSSEASECAITMAQIIVNCYNSDDKDFILSNVNSGIMDLVARGKEDLKLNPTGYCMHTLEVAIRGFYKYNNFIDGLMYVISLGEDTDTVGAVYGQIAGAYYGLSGIPDYYKENVFWYDDIIELGNKLVDLSEEK